MVTAADSLPPPLVSNSKRPFTVFEASVARRSGELQPGDAFGALLLNQSSLPTAVK